jgi:hypothetical protein
MSLLPLRLRGAGVLAMNALTQSQLAVLWIISNTRLQACPWEFFSKGEQRSIRVLRALGALEYLGRRSPLVALSMTGKEIAQRIRLSRRGLWLEYRRHKVIGSEFDEDRVPLDLRLHVARSG